ncbi:MAG: sigma-70 family RNA polymerase sigma factor [Bacteroidota bacterium]
MNIDSALIRSKLVSQAYHLLGSIADAEDIVQDVLEAWQSISPDQIVSPNAYLHRSVANRSFNRLKEMKRSRNHYPGTWLPSPIPSTSEHPHLQDQTYHVSMGLLVIMEILTPAERTVFVLREVFDWAYESIGQIVGKSETNCRQINRRAQAKIHQQSPVQGLPPEVLSPLLEAFQSGIESGNLDPLLNLLQEDVVFLSDGGGKVPAAQKPLYGKSTVSKFLKGIQRQLPADSQFVLSKLNETVALIIRDGRGKVASVMSVDFSQNGRIKSVYIMRNPDKLAHLNSQDQKNPTE